MVTIYACFTWQRCTIPLDRSPWRVNDPLGRVKWPKHSTDHASKVFSNAHLFSSENELFSLCLQNTIQFPVYSVNFCCIWNVSDVKAAIASIFQPYVKMSKQMKITHVQTYVIDTWKYFLKCKRECTYCKSKCTFSLARPAGQVGPKTNCTPLHWQTV
jgi:hypothetical protein